MREKELFKIANAFPSAYITAAMAGTRSVSEYRPKTTVKAAITVVLDNKVAVVRVAIYHHGTLPVFLCH